MERENNTAVGFDQPLHVSPADDIKAYIKSKTAKIVFISIASISIIFVILIFAFVFREALPIFRKVRLTDLILSSSWHPESTTPSFGSFSIIMGTVYTTVLSMMIAVPIGILSAIFLSDVVSNKIRNAIKPAIEILAAIPSVAYGFFAVLILAPLMQKHLGFSTGTNILNTSLILAVMALPTIISVAEDSLSSVGRELREASYGLGATRAETIIKVIIPAASGGITVGIILGMMRAIGETMVVLMASGNANQLPSPLWDLSAPIRTMTATIAGDMGETVKGSEHYHALFALGLILLVSTFSLNMLSEYIKMKVKKA